MRSSAVGLATSRPDPASLPCHDGPKAALPNPSTPSSPLPNAPFPSPSDTSSLGIRGKNIEGGVRETMNHDTPNLGQHSSEACSWGKSGTTTQDSAPSWVTSSVPPYLLSQQGPTPPWSPAGGLQKQQQVDPHRSPSPVGPSGLNAQTAMTSEGGRVLSSGEPAPHSLAAWMPPTAAWWESKPAVTSSPQKMHHDGAAT